ncbi:MAG: metal ABC transporter substrate-binding protein [Eubacteriales bacterium]|nr:metal ABC transporter substrate-binding protein [Eubacteriales bacterium]
MRRTKRLRVKRLAALLLSLCLAAAAAGCHTTGGGTHQDPGGESDGAQRLQVVTTVFPQYDFARAIAGEEADVTMLLRPGEEIHSYEPTPRDIMTIQNCDLFIYVGGENDVWVDRILGNMGTGRPGTLRLVDLVDTVAEEHVEGMMPERGGHSHEGHEQDEEEQGSHDHGEAEPDDHDHGEEEHGDHDHDASAVPGGDSSHEEHGEADEHVWTSPRNAARITAEIAEAMCALDPVHAEVFAENAEAYEAEILALDEEYRALADSAVRKTIVFGDRFPIRYFAQEYGLTYYAAFPGCSSESEPSAATLAFLIDKVRDERIPVVFSIEFSTGSIARAICESSGAQQRVFHTCHNVTRDEFESGATYVSLMRGNMEGVREALCGGTAD